VVPHIHAYVTVVKARRGKKWREDEEEDVGSYWLTLRERKDSGN
jgi:hypothetical protein